MPEDVKTDNKKKESLPKRILKGFWRQILKYFLEGLIVLIPLAVTIWLVYWIFSQLDGLISPLLVLIFGHPVPGLGFLIIIGFIILVGFVVIHIGMRKMVVFLEKLIVKIPLIGLIYGGIRQILSSFADTSENKFLEVIFMEFPRKGIYTVGFVTSKTRDNQGNTLLNVFVPTAPNPTSGFLQIVPAKDVIKTSMSIDDAMKLVISAGKVSNKEIKNITQQPGIET